MPMHACSIRQTSTCIRRGKLFRFFVIGVVAWVAVSMVSIVFVTLYYERIKFNSLFLKDKGVVCQPPELLDSIAVQLSHACRRLNQFNVTYWLDRGTLLGILRQGSILRHDVDADIAFLIQGDEKVKKAVRTSYGNCCEVPSVDILAYAVTSDGGTLGRCRREHEINVINRLIEWKIQYPLEWILPTQPVGHGQFSHCRMPSMPNRVVAQLYGPQWQENVTCFKRDVYNRIACPHAIEIVGLPELYLPRIGGIYEASNLEPGANNAHQIIYKQAQGRLHLFFWLPYLHWRVGYDVVSKEGADMLHSEPVDLFACPENAGAWFSIKNLNRSMGRGWSKSITVRKYDALPDLHTLPLPD